MKQKIMLLLALAGLTGMTHACGYDDSTYCTPWTMDGFFGISNYANVNNNDANTAVGRLSIGHVLVKKEYWQIGADVGIQSGSTIRLEFPKEDIAMLGGVPIEADMKPFLDALLGFKFKPMEEMPLELWFKGGVAYRQFRMDRTSIPDLNQFAPEIQAGIGYRINEQLSFNLGYQYIHGQNPILTVNPVDETGIVQNIPAQQAFIIGLSFNF